MGVYLSHPASLGHDTGAHPEQAARLRSVESMLAAADWLGWERVQSPPASSAMIERVHPAAHVEAMAAAARRAASTGSAVLLDADTVVSPGSFDAALHAAGGAVEMVRRLLAGDERVGFSAHRPPGHHAPAAHAMGFCLFNNVAVAARHALDELGRERVAIIDWDVHHGNGTQDIFWDSDAVLFCSVHQMPLYPGSGHASEIGAGAGEGYTVNLPVPPGAGDDVFNELVRDEISDRVRAFAPDLLLVSAGFDAHREDPLAECEVSEAGFAEMAHTVGALAEGLGIPLGLVLEGGYAIDALARSVLATMEALSGPAAS